MYKMYLSCFVQYNKLQLRVEDNRFSHGYRPLLFYLLKPVYSCYQTND